MIKAKTQEIVRVEFVWNTDGFDFYFEQFREWCQKEGIKVQIGSCGTAGNGIIGYYLKDDWEKARKWLKDHNVAIDNS